MRYSAEQMFAVVDDVARYPEFLPWCDSVEILEDSNEHMVATLWLAKGGVRQSFTTRNEKAPGRIDMALVQGPFRRLSGFWEFSQLGDEGSKVSMTLEFDFDGRMMKGLLGPVFESAADRLVEAFCQRADRIYD